MSRPKEAGGVAAEYPGNQSRIDLHTHTHTHLHTYTQDIPSQREESRELGTFRESSESRMDRCPLCVCVCACACKCECECVSV